MDNTLTAIDISKLPMPDVIRQVAADVILQEMLADLVARDPTLKNLLPSNPIYTLLEVAAYREAVRRYQSNEDAKAVMVALASDADLDHLAALFRVKRLVLDAGDPSKGIPRRWRVMPHFGGVSSLHRKATASPVRKALTSTMPSAPMPTCLTSAPPVQPLGTSSSPYYHAAPTDSPHKTCLTPLWPLSTKNQYAP